MNKSKIARLVFKMVFGYFLLVLPTPETLASDCLPERYELIPENWTPSLEQTRDYLDESFKVNAEVPQQTLNQMSKNLADISDAQLFIVYIRLVQTLDARGQAELFDEQQRWLAERATAAQAAVISKGGSLAPLEYSGAFKKITDERLGELQKRLQQARNINPSK